MSKTCNDPIDCGREFGEIGARLDGIERQCSALWTKIDEQGKALQRVQLTLATNKGVMMTISWAISGLIAFLTAWFTRKGE